MARLDRCGTSFGLKMHFANDIVDVTDSQTAGWVTAALHKAAELGMPVIIHFGDDALLCGNPIASDPAEQCFASPNTAGMKDAMTVLLTQILPKTPGLHLSLAHLTGSGNFTGWIQEMLKMVIEATKPGGALEQAEVSVFIDIGAGFNMKSDSVCQSSEGGASCTVPAVSTPDLRAMGALLRELGLERVMWGSDLDTSAYSTALERWPETGLSAAEFEVIAYQTGDNFRNATPRR